MNVATIGSGVIVERMIEAMRLDGRYNLYCGYCLCGKSKLFTLFTIKNGVGT